MIFAMSVTRFLESTDLKRLYVENYIIGTKKTKRKIEKTDTLKTFNIKFLKLFARVSLT